jgi:two-component system cell cycle response regulator DivK
MQETTKGAGRGRTVVVVEDKVRSRRLVRDLLELSGFLPVEAESAEEGLVAVRACAPCMVLLDIQLPGMDGEEALRELRADPVTAGIPAVAVTAYAMRGDEERLLALGFDGYIAKPIDTRTFVGQLVDLLDGHER